MALNKRTMAVCSKCGAVIQTWAWFMRYREFIRCHDHPHASLKQQTITFEDDDATDMRQVQQAV